MPQKNQIDSSADSISRSFSSITVPPLPEDQIQNKEDNDDNDGPEDRFFPDCLRAVVRNWRHAIDKPGKLSGRYRLGHQAYYHCDDDTDNPAPQRAIKILGHRLR